MTPLTLYPQEIIQLQKGEVLIVRPVEPQLIGEIALTETADDFTWLFYDKEGFNQFRKHPFGPVGSEIAIVGSELSEAFDIPDYIAIHEGTTCKRVQDVTEEEALACGSLPSSYIDMDGPINGNIQLVGGMASALGNLHIVWDSRHPEHPWQDNPLACLGKLKLKGEG